MKNGKSHNRHAVKLAGIIQNGPAVITVPPVQKFKITITANAGEGREIKTKAGDIIDHPIVKSRGRVFFYYERYEVKVVERFIREGVPSLMPARAVPGSMIERTDYEIAVATEVDEVTTLQENYKKAQP